MTSPPEGTCHSCGATALANARFCSSCGTPVTPPTCFACSEPLLANARFCASCGTPVDGPSRPVEASAPVAERRVTSVLFADLVGFTTLSEARDAEDVRELLSRYFAESRIIISRYGGTVEKFIGDAVMAVWGVPVAHEDDAERAVRAGLELVHAIAGLGEDVGAAGLTMRVGVVTGEVAVTLGATAEGMVAGDAVNTASRVQSTATPGEVWVDESTRALSAAAIAFEDRGEHELKGKADSIRLFAARAVVADVGGVGRVDGLEAPLTGRDRELRLIKELFHATEEARRPRLIVLDGDPGIGKSRLAREFEKYADGLSATTRWHRGRCLSYGEGVAFWALAEAVRSRLGLIDVENDEDASERLSAGLAEYVPELEEREWLRPRIAALVGASMGTSFAREDLFAAWTAFLERVGGDGEPVVLVIDDAQYADDGLLDFLDHMLVNGRAGIFVLALARPELMARRQDLGGRRTTVVRLDPLDDAAMATLIDGLVIGLPDSTRAALVSRADGVPLFAVETVRALIDRDLVVPQGGRYVLAEGSALDLDTIGAPASLQALVAARLDALTADERRVVADACVLGSSFTRGGLAALGDTRSDLDAVLAALQRKEIVSLQLDRFSAERGQHRFVQSVVRQVAYATMSKRDRKAKHIAAARYLQSAADVGDELAVVIAQHLVDAVDASSPDDSDTNALSIEARELLEQAAAHASSLGATAESQHLYEAAVARADTPELRARLLLAAAEAAKHAGDYSALTAHAQQAMALFDELAEPVEAGVAAAEYAWGVSQLTGHRAGIEVAEARWAALDGTAGADRALLQLSFVLGYAYSNLGDWDTASRYLERRMLLAEESAEPKEIVSAHITMGHRYLTLGAPATAFALTQAAADRARAHDLTGLHAQALNNLASGQASRDLPAALESGRNGIAAARKSGIRGYIDYTLANYALALWSAGQVREARSAAREALEAVVMPGMWALLTTVDAWTSAAMGEPPLDIPERDYPQDDVGVRAWLSGLEIAQARAAGDLSRVVPHLEQSLADVLAANGLDDDFIFLWPPLVETALHAGDLRLAERIFLPGGSAPQGKLSPGVKAQVLRLRGLIAADRGDDAAVVEVDLRAGIAALDHFGAQGLHARAEEEFGRWLASQGRTSEAEPLLAEARATYEQIGAVGWLAQLESTAHAR